MQHKSSDNHLFPSCGFMIWFLIPEAVHTRWSKTAHTVEFVKAGDTVAGDFVNTFTTARSKLARRLPLVPSIWVIATPAVTSSGPAPPHHGYSLRPPPFSEALRAAHRQSCRLHQKPQLETLVPESAKFWHVHLTNLARRAILGSDIHTNIHHAIWCRGHHECSHYYQNVDTPVSIPISSRVDA